MAKRERDFEPIMSDLLMKGIGKDLFLIMEGVKIAKRGRPGTRHAGKWVPLEPGYEIYEEDGEGGDRVITVIRRGVRVH